MKSGMYLTKDDLLERLKPENFKSPYEIMNAVYDKFACGISRETAQKIYDDFNKHYAFEFVS